MDNNYRNLFTPFSICGRQIKNRYFMAPMGTTTANGRPSQRMAALPSMSLEHSTSGRSVVPAVLKIWKPFCSGKMIRGNKS